MEVTFYTQDSRSLSDTVKDLAENSSSINIAVAYLSADGLEEVRPLFRSVDVRIICGVHGCISDLWALKDLVCRADLHVKGNVFVGQNLFHPKLYIFNRGDQGIAVIIGSPNFTIGGLKTNEEIYVVVKRGQDSEQSIRDSAAYFEQLWAHRSVPVERYLAQHPEYKTRDILYEQLTAEQDEILRALQPVAEREASFTFHNRVIPTLYRHGRQTIPTEYNGLLNGRIGLGSSMPFNVVLPDGESVGGKIRYGLSSWGNYYEIGVSGGVNVGKLQNLISQDDMLEYHVDIAHRIVSIKTIAGERQR